MLSRSHHHQINFTAITGVAGRTLERLIALDEGPGVIELSPRWRGILETIFRFGSSGAVAPRRAKGQP
jgi:hypothetical protein